MICEHCGEHADKLVEIDGGGGQTIKVCEICLIEIISNKLADLEYPEEKDPFAGMDRKYIQ